MFLFQILVLSLNPSNSSKTSPKMFQIRKKKKMVINNSNDLNGYIKKKNKLRLILLRQFYTICCKILSLCLLVYTNKIYQVIKEFFFIHNL